MTQTTRSRLTGPFAELEDRDQRQALDEELASLPENYRGPLVLHYLDGKSNQQVADELGLSVSAVEGRLKRGKKELRLRLARRGIGLSVAVAAMHAVQSLAQAAPVDTLITRTIDAGLSYAGGEPAGPVFSPEAARLAGQELVTMSTTSTVTLAAIVLLPLTLGFAGHDAVPTTAAQLTVSTVIGQADGEEGGVAAEVAEDFGDTGLFVFEPNLDIQVSDDGKVVVRYTDQEGREATLNGSKIRLTRDERGHLIAKVEGETDSDVELKSGNRTVSAGRLRLNLTTTETLSAFDADGETLEDFGSEGSESSAIPEEFRDRLPFGMGMNASESDQTPAEGSVRPKSPAPGDLLSYETRSPNVERIRTELENQTEVQFVDTPLADAMDYIAQLHNITIMLDETALSEVGIPIDEPVNLIMNGVQLQSVLNLMLRPLGTTTIIWDEVLTVTTREVADEFYETRVYNVRTLGEDNNVQLVQLLETSIPEARWVSTDKTGGSVALVDDALVVKQTQATHTRIADLLSQLRRHQQVSTNTFEYEGIKQSAQPMAADEKQSIVRLEIDAAGGVYWNGKLMFREGLLDLVKAQQPELVELRASHDASTEAVQNLIKLLQSAGVQEMKFSLKAVASPPKENQSSSQADTDFEVSQLMIYDVSDLLADVSDSETNQSQENIKNILQEVVAQSVGQIANFYSLRTGQLVVMTTATGHNAINEALRTLRKDTDNRTGEKSKIDEKLSESRAESTKSLPATWEDYSSLRLKRLLDAGKTTVVFFTADWSGPCREFEADALRADATFDFMRQHDIRILRFDVTHEDRAERIARESLDINAVPTTLVYSPLDRESPKRLVGIHSQASILNLLKKSVESSVGTEAE